MKKLNSAKILVFLSIIGILYNLLVLTGIIPYQYSWGGRLETYEQVLKFETIGLLMNLFIIFIVAMKAGYIKQFLHKNIISVILWILVLMFALNTIGNLFALSATEKIVFTPLTLLSTYLFFRLARNKG